MAYLSEPLSPSSFGILATTGLAHLFSADSGSLASNKPLRDLNIITNENIQGEDQCQNLLFENATGPLKSDKVPAKIPVNYIFEGEEEQLRKSIDETSSEDSLQLNVDVTAELQPRCFSDGLITYVANSTPVCPPTESPRTLVASILVLNSAIATASVSFSVELPSLLRALQDDTAATTKFDSFRDFDATVSGHKVIYRAFQDILSRWCLERIYGNDTATLAAKESLLRWVAQVVFSIGVSVGQLAPSNESDPIARLIRGIESFPDSLVPGLAKIVDYSSGLSSCIETISSSQFTDMEIFLPKAGDTFDSEEMLELSLTTDSVWEGSRREVRFACGLGLRKAGKTLLKSSVQSRSAQAP